MCARARARVCVCVCVLCFVCVYLRMRACVRACVCLCVFSCECHCKREQLSQSYTRLDLTAVYISSMVVNEHSQYVDYKSVQNKHVNPYASDLASLTLTWHAQR